MMKYFVICIFLMLSSITYGAYYLIFTPSVIEQEKTFIIPKGADIEQISVMLNSSGINNANPMLLRLMLLYLKLTDQEYKIKNGEFMLYPKISLWQVLQKITVGEFIMRSFTVIEGMTNFQILHKLNAEEALIGTINEECFLNKSSDLICIVETTPTFYPFPETYHFTYGIKKNALLETMINKGSEKIDFFWSQNRNKALKSKNDLLVLASIIEKETNIIEEMPRISGVFTNRLLKNMKLQADPTVIYAITRGRVALERTLTKEDLKIEDPYNTYHIYGLPPKAICNPGQKALHAAANPLITDELYFVANGIGGHNFANNINDHIKHINKR